MTDDNLNKVIGFKKWIDIAFSVSATNLSYALLILSS